MSFAERESSRTRGEPVSLFLFQGADPGVEGLMRSVVLSPGATEYGLGTTKVTTGALRANHGANLPVTDFVASLNDLQSVAPLLGRVTITVAWHGDDLRCGECEIRPRISAFYNGSAGTPYDWAVGPVTRTGATVVSAAGLRPAFGGAPSDRSLYEAIVELKARGYEVVILPVLLMDIASGNGLADPEGAAEQPAYPSHRRITCHPAPGQPSTVDKTATAATQVDAFFGAVDNTDFAWNGTTKTVTYSGSATEWSYRRFILHLATIADAGGADEFLIGSDLVGLTRVRSGAASFPAVAHLIDLAAEARTILGESVRISYAAHWSEYHSYRPDDGSDDVFFNLDPLWSDNEIDFVGINAFFPISDWRTSGDNADAAAGFLGPLERRYLQANIEGGEHFDWTYADSSARTAQTRTTIADAAEGKAWVFRGKDMRSWWSNAHYDRPGGTESGTPTGWTPQSKPIVLTSLGAPAINAAARQPGTTIDSVSSESAAPYGSNENREDASQRAVIEAWLDYWRPENGRNPTSSVYAAPMIEWASSAISSWDVRPWPSFPNLSTIWFDTADWAKGYSVNGRLVAGRGFAAEHLGTYAYTDSEQPIVRDGVTYTPISVRRGVIEASGTLDNSGLVIEMPQNVSIADLFRAYPPAGVFNLFIFEGHVGDDPDNPANFPAVWNGRVLSGADRVNTYEITCEPIARMMKRVGLRRHWQIGCPYPLYGGNCKASQAAATIVREVQSVDAARVTLAEGWDSVHEGSKYAGGLLTWTKSNGSREVRSVLKIEDDNTLLIGGTTRGLTAGMDVEIALGCDHQMSGCALHGNILNFGGHPWIPTKNPIGLTNNYY